MGGDDSTPDQREVHSARPHIKFMKKVEFWIDMTLNVDRPYAKTAYLNSQDAEEKSSTYITKVVNADYAEKLESQIEELKELHRMQLAACSTAALANTEKSKEFRIDKASPYWTPAYQDVCDSVDREINYRTALEEAAEYADTDDVNGYAGILARNALKR